MIVVPGNSGCTVEIIEKKEKCLVRKSTTDSEYFKRLELQSLKQKQYIDYLELVKNISAPEIIESELTDTSFSFLMEYIRYLDCITFLSNAGKKEIDYFFKKIVDLIDFEISKSKKCDVMSTFDLKYRDTVSNIKIIDSFKKSELKKIERKIYFSDTMILPVGMCHGDLTFSNMLISRDCKNICLIDFLDNFAETPLQDMVKIRQDTSFLWTSRIFSGNIDSLRNSIVMKYLDSAFDKSFSRHDFYRREYERFQILNILRIFRYTSNIETLKYLKDCILSLV